MIAVSIVLTTCSGTDLPLIAEDGSVTSLAKNRESKGLSPFDVERQRVWEGKHGFPAFQASLIKWTQSI